MAHLHDVLDNDPHFIINAETRAIEHASDKDLVLIQGDHNSERVTFDVPKTIDGHNTELCNVVRIHFLNISSGSNLESNPGIYEVDDLKPHPEDDTKLTFSWLLSKDATMYVGTLTFVVEFLCKNENSVIEYAWHTGTHTAGVILEGMNNSDIIIGANYDVLDQWLGTIEIRSNAAMEAAITSINNARDAAKDKAIELIDEHANTVKEDLEIHKLSVGGALVQTTGQSTDKVMSQKSTTDAINQVEANVNEDISEIRADVNAKHTDLLEQITAASAYVKVDVTDVDHDGDPILWMVDGKTYVVDTPYENVRDNDQVPSIILESEIVDSAGNPLAGGSVELIPPSNEYWRDITHVRVIDYIVREHEIPQGERNIYTGVDVTVTIDMHGVNRQVTAFYEWYDQSDEMLILGGNGPAIQTRACCIVFPTEDPKVYELNYEPQPLDINAVGITDITKTSTTGLNNTYTIQLSNGEKKTFTVKDGVGVNDVSITKRGDYEDEYTVSLTNGEEYTFTVPNSNSVGIQTSDSGNSIHATDVIPLEHTVKTKVRSKNLIVYPYADMTGEDVTKDGVTYTFDESDGSITLNGTASYNTSLSIAYQHQRKISVTKGKTYTLSCISNLTTARGYVYFQIYKNGENVQNKTVRNNDVTTFVAEHDGYVSMGIVLLSGVVYANDRVQVQLEEGDTVTPYAKYVNPLEVTLRRCGKNLIKYPHAMTTGTIEGVVYTDNGDGTVTVNGSATDNSIHYTSQTQASAIHLGPGTYTLSGCPAGGSDNTYRLTVKTNDAQPVYYHDFGAGCTFTITAEKIIYIYIRVASGTSVSSLIFKPQLEVGDTATEFEQYAGTEYGIASDGNPVSRVTAAGPIMNLMTDKVGTIIDATYNVDQNVIVEDILRATDDGVTTIEAAKSAALSEIEEGKSATIENAVRESVTEAINNAKEEFSEESIHNWLDEHPEATTTVQDGSLTQAKFADGELSVITVHSLAELKSAIANDKRNIALGASFAVGEEITFKPNTSFYGCGYTITREAGYEHELIRLGANCRIQDLVINGNRTAMLNPESLETCDLCGAPFCIIENVTIQDGNEGIIVYTDNIVRNCKIYNCGGNGIHLSSGHRSRIENNVIIGTNLDDRFALNNGCIFSCMFNVDVVISNNYLEGGYSGVGSIDLLNNSNIKVIGNTIKDCTYATTISANTDTEVGSDTYGLPIGPKNIIFAKNHFINCNQFMIYSHTNSIANIIDCIISNNIFEGTYIDVNRVGGITISGNIFKGNIEAPYIESRSSSRLHILDNQMRGVSESVNGLDLEDCDNLCVKNNHICTQKVRIVTCRHISVIGNAFHQQYVAGARDYFISFSTNNNVIFAQNIVVAYTGCLRITSYSTVVGNHCYLYESAPQYVMEVPTSENNVVVKDNRKVGGSISLKANDTNAYENNEVALYDDVFQTLTMTLTNVTSSSVPTKIILGDAFSFVLSANEGYSLPDTISVTNGGQESTRAQDYYYDKTTGKVTISCVKGAVVITATGVTS